MTDAAYGAEWYHQAACAGADERLFFSVGKPGKAGMQNGTDLAAGKAICALCPVAGPCLEDALSLPSHEDFGLRAGTSRSERRRMRALRGMR